MSGARITAPTVPLLRDTVEPSLNTSEYQIR